MAIKNKRQGPQPLRIDGEEWKVLARAGKKVEAIKMIVDNHRSRMKSVSVAEAKNTVERFLATGQ